MTNITNPKRRARTDDTAHTTTHTNGNGAPRPTFDLSSRYMADTLTIDIADPADGTLTGMTWTIGSQFSKEARASVLSATKLRLNAKGEVEADGAASLADTILDQLVAVTLTWSGFVVDGVPLDCTAANVRALLTDTRTAWLRPQVQAGYLSLSRFFGIGNAT